MINNIIIENYHIIIFLIISIFMSIEDIKKMEVSLVKQFILFLFAIYVLIFDKDVDYATLFPSLILISVAMIFLKMGGADKKILILSVIILKSDIATFFYILSIINLINWIKFKKYDKETNKKYPFVPLITLTLTILLIKKLF